MRGWFDGSACNSGPTSTDRSDRGNEHYTEPGSARFCDPICSCSVAARRPSNRPFRSTSVPPLLCG